MHKKRTCTARPSKSRPTWTETLVIGPLSCPSKKEEQSRWPNDLSASGWIFSSFPTWESRLEVQPCKIHAKIQGDNSSIDSGLFWSNAMKKPRLTCAYGCVVESSGYKSRSSSTRRLLPSWDCFAKDSWRCPSIVDGPSLLGLLVISLSILISNFCPSFDCFTKDTWWDSWVNHWKTISSGILRHFLVISFFLFHLAFFAKNTWWSVPSNHRRSTPSGILSHFLFLI